MGRCVKFSQVCKKFQPNYKDLPLAKKFYARHEAIVRDDIKNGSVKFHEELDRREHFDLRKQRQVPLTENQMYGWLENRALQLSPGDVAQRRVGRTMDEVLKRQGEIWRACNEWYKLH